MMGLAGVTSRSAYDDLQNEDFGATTESAQQRDFDILSPILVLICRGSWTVI